MNDCCDVAIFNSVSSLARLNEICDGCLDQKICELGYKVNKGWDELTEIDKELNTIRKKGLITALDIEDYEKAFNNMFIHLHSLALVQQKSIHSIIEQMKRLKKNIKEKDDQ